MKPDESPLRIIGNESNFEYQIEPGNKPETKQSDAPAEKTEPADNIFSDLNPYINNDTATNDGGIVETLDTAFHNKPGTTEGENPSGSDRADYYEAQAQGKSDAQEETDALNTGTTS